MQSEDKGKTQQSTRVAARMRERKRERHCEGEDVDRKMAAANSSVSTDLAFIPAVQTFRRGDLRQFPAVSSVPASKIKPCWPECTFCRKTLILGMLTFILIDAATGIGFAFYPFIHLNKKGKQCLLSRFLLLVDQL